MPRKSNKKPAIIEALSQKGADPIKVAQEFKVTQSYVYHLDKKRRLGDNFGLSANSNLSSAVQPGFNSPQGDLFNTLALSSLRRNGGDIAEEYLRELQGYLGAQMYKEMGNHPIVAAVLQAIKMTLRKVQWYAVASKSGREEEVDFLNQCMNDMDHTWSDFVDEALSMLQYGFAPFEKVYKIRRGGMNRPGPKVTASRFSDGKIGWDKFVLIGQDTLAPGNSWIFDNYTGELKGLNQLPPPGNIILNLKQIPVSIGINKLILFRTTKYKDNPEGLSVLRPMFRAYYYATNLEEVEAISAERMGAGFPVVYLGDDISKSQNNNGEINEYRKAVRNIRIDEQMGIVIPHPKMGSGAREGQGVLLELLTPGTQMLDFSKIIERHEKRMAMVGLAQFIHLGMGQFGSGNLADVTTDFFQTAVSAWADSLRDTINRSAVIPLLQLNKMNAEDPILIEHSSVGNTDLKVIADYINKTVGAKVIEPDDMLEDALRKLAGFPEKDESTVRDVMVEVDGDGGTRMDRTKRTKPANQRNTNPVSEKPQDTPAPQARKPMRASDDEGDMNKDTYALLSKAMDIASNSNKSPASVTVNTSIDDRVVDKLSKIADKPIVVNVPTPVVNVTMPEQAAVVVPAPNVTVQSPKIPQIVVNVPDQPTPVINLNPEIKVDVPPTIVNVNAELTMPPTEETVTVERDTKTREIKSMRKIKRMKRD